MSDRFDEQARDIDPPGIADDFMDPAEWHAAVAAILRAADANARTALLDTAIEQAGSGAGEVGAPVKPMLTGWRESAIGIWHRALARGGRFGAKAYKIGEAWAWEMYVGERCVSSGQFPDLASAKRAADEAARRYYTLPEDAPSQPAPVGSADLSDAEIEECARAGDRRN